MCVRIHTYVHAYTHTQMSVMCLRSAGEYVCTYTYIYTYTHVYMYLLHTFTYSQCQRWSRVVLCLPSAGEGHVPLAQRAPARIAFHGQMAKKVTTDGDGVVNMQT